MALKGWVFGGVVVAAAAYVAWPYYTLYRINHALESGDRSALEGLVDWPAVEGGIRSDIDIRRSVPVSEGDEGASGEGSVTGRLAGILAPAMNDMLVQAYASPEGLARVIREGKVDLESEAAALSEAQKVAREALEATRQAAISESDSELPTAVGEVVTAARLKIDGAQAAASDTYDSLRRDFDYLFFTDALTFRAQYSMASPNQTAPLVLVLKLQQLQWQLTTVHLPE